VSRDSGTIAEAARDFLDASHEEWASPPAQEAYKRIHELSKKASQADKDRGAELLAASLEEWSGEPLGLVALLVGSLVESGASPRLPFAPLASRMKSVTSATLVMARAIARGLPNDGEENDEAFNAAFLAAQARQPEEAELALAFSNIALATIALLSRSPENRAVARRDCEHLDRARELANERMAPGNAKFLSKMLHVLDGESLLVLHPASVRGFDVAITGIADNFQLHTLLAAALIPLGLPGKPPAQAIVSCARGEGPQCLTMGSDGVFNLHHWTALGGDGKLPEGQDARTSAHWIWNEGVPADIRLFEGRRIVLLAPPPYERHWNTNRLFDAMPASAAVARTLEAHEVAGWIEKLSKAPRPAMPHVMHGGP
jgi:hypothetical protein